MEDAQSPPPRLRQSPSFENLMKTPAKRMDLRRSISDTDLALAASPPSVWICDLCMYENVDPTKKKCALCGTTRDQNSPSTPDSDDGDNTNNNNNAASAPIDMRRERFDRGNSLVKQEDAGIMVGRVSTSSTIDSATMGIIVDNEEDDENNKENEIIGGITVDEEAASAHPPRVHKDHSSRGSEGSEQFDEVAPLPSSNTKDRPSIDQLKDTAENLSFRLHDVVVQSAESQSDDSLQHNNSSGQGMAMMGESTATLLVSNVKPAPRHSEQTVQASNASKAVAAAIGIDDDDDMDLNQMYKQQLEEDVALDQMYAQQLNSQPINIVAPHTISDDAGIEVPPSPQDKQLEGIPLNILIGSHDVDNPPDDLTDGVAVPRHDALFPLNNSEREDDEGEPPVEAARNHNDDAGVSPKNIGFEQAPILPLEQEEAMEKEDEARDHNDDVGAFPKNIGFEQAPMLPLEQEEAMEDTTRNNSNIDAYPIHIGFEQAPVSEGAPTTVSAKAPQSPAEDFELEQLYATGISNIESQKTFPVSRSIPLDVPPDLEEDEERDYFPAPQDMPSDTPAPPALPRHVEGGDFAQQQQGDIEEAKLPKNPTYGGPIAKSVPIKRRICRLVALLVAIAVVVLSIMFVSNGDDGEAEDPDGTGVLVTASAPPSVFVSPTAFPTIPVTLSPVPTVPPTTAAPATRSPTSAPVQATLSPTSMPNIFPTTPAPTPTPTRAPTPLPSPAPTPGPTLVPTDSPTESPTASPTMKPTPAPTPVPTPAPTDPPTESPTRSPTKRPTPAPTSDPTDSPTKAPTRSPTLAPQATRRPTPSPTTSPTAAPTEDLEEEFAPAQVDILGSVPGSRFGTSVSTDGPGELLAAVGDSGLDGVQVYERGSGSWGLLAEIDLDGSTIFSGSSVVSIASPDGVPCVAIASISSFRVVQYVNGAWIPRGQNEISWRSSNGEVESSVSTSAIALSRDGTVLATGFLDTSKELIMVRVFEWNESSQRWQQRGNSITRSPPLVGFQFLSMSLALSGNGQVVSIGDWVLSQPASSVETFEWSNNTWNARGATLTFFWGPAQVTLSDSGQRLGVAIPAPESTHIYEWDGSNAYSELNRGIPGGSSISMNRGGLRVAVGRPSASAVSVYDNVDGDWVNVDVTGESGSRFGASVSMASNGNVLVVGSPLDRSAGVNAGRVVVYQ